MSHVVITCTCRRWDQLQEANECEVPGHGTMPPDPVDPKDLVAAGDEASKHLNEAVTSLMRARAAWVSRGLDSTNPFPVSLDHLAGRITRQNEHLRKWTAAAAVVAKRRKS